MSVDQATFTITVKFNGAVSGSYHVSVTSKINGKLSSSQLELNVGSKVTSISPKQGSRYGGTLMTITGENFGYQVTDNPVKIGDEYCYVLTSTPT